MLFNKKRVTILLIASLSFSAFAEEESHSESEEVHEEVAKLTTEEIAEFGIVIASARGGVIATEIQLNGEVAINEEGVTHISSRFAGAIKQVNVRQGQYVRRGTVMAVIENSSNLTRFNVTASSSGVVTFKDAAVGENTDVGQELFRVSNFATVWVNLAVYQKDMQSVTRDQSIRIVDPFSGVETTGSIDYISPIMDEESRTVAVRTTLPNSDGAWKPGMFITGFVALDSSNANVRLPLSAVHQFEGESVAFVQDEDGFEPRPLILGKSNEKFVEVITGINVGDNYVSENGFIIKSELGKSEMGEGHGGH